MVYVKNFQGKKDSERINNAILGRGADGMVVIEPKENGEPWLLDTAILLPENTTVIIRSCKIKLSDKCRDNFFRTANCGVGIDVPEKIKNVRIIGEGKAILEGADHPRAVGDSSKILANPCPFEVEDLCKYGDWIPAERRYPDKLDFGDRHNHSFGTDAGKENESQYGDWRGIGILFANVDDFEITNLCIVESHGWAISIEAGTHGRITKIDFDARISKRIDGMLQNMENQDGIDIRNGCNNIIISDITGMTGDDVIALTAIARKDAPRKKGGSFKCTHVMNNDWKNREADIHDIMITNVKATSYHCWVVRLLPVDTRIYNIVIDNVIDVGGDATHHGTLLLGENGYGATQDKDVELMDNVVISNVVSAGLSHGIRIGGYMHRSVIGNVVHTTPSSPNLVVDYKGDDGDVTFYNMR